MQRHSLIECTYIYISIADACQRNSLMQANLHRFYIYIYIYVYINCLHVPCMGSRSYSYAAVCLLQGGPTIWACVPGWLVVLQCLLGHVAAMVGAVDADRCHLGQGSTLSLKAIIVICTCQKRIYIYIYIYVDIYIYMLHDLLIFIYVFFVAFHARTVLFRA